MAVKLFHFLGLVRFSHTLFALPFALASAVWAAGGLPDLRTTLLIVLAMVLCRNTAMAFNRLIDAEIDGRNPRTASRHLPAGSLDKREVAVFLAANALGFVATTWFINMLAFSLSLPALAAVCFYSWTKRFTSFSHLFLGLAIGISPVGAWIAVRGSFALEPMLLGLVLLLWISGFDIIYATQDYEFDRRMGLHSLVVRLGLAGALRAALFLHLGMLVLLGAMAWLEPLGTAYRTSLGIVAALLLYLHRFRRSASLAGLNHDFFLANAAVSFVLMLGIILSVMEA